MRAVLVQHHLSLGCLAVCLCVCIVYCTSHGSYAQHAAALLKALSSQANRLAHSSSRNILNLLLIRSVRFTTKWKLRNLREREKFSVYRWKKGERRKLVSICSPGKYEYLNFIIQLLLLLSRLLYCFDIYVNI